MTRVRKSPLLGCIADDFTGATDLAINLVNGGFRVLQLLNVPEKAIEGLNDFDAIVIALKTRSIPVADAKAESLAALRYLQDQGIERFYFKYCSTFDSTAEGNIGPVADALREELQVDRALYCPAFPQAGRTVYQGHLFVGDRLLNESGMQNHPLNPMHDADLVRFLGTQVSQDVGLLGFEHLSDPEQVRQRLDEIADEGCTHVIVDACSDGQLQTIAEAIFDEPLITGGSGLARFLPHAYRLNRLAEPALAKPEVPAVRGKSVVLAGSCSKATQRQVNYMVQRCPAERIDIHASLRNPAAEVDRLLDWIAAQESKSTVMVTSTSPPEQVSELQTSHGVDKVAYAIESVFGQLSVQLVQNNGFQRLVVAGGETSGAVVKSLGVQSLRIGPQICTGVPWTETEYNLDGSSIPLALALKSGNFGDERFFETALGMLHE